MTPTLRPAIDVSKVRILSPVLLLSMMAAATTAASGLLPSSAFADPRYEVMNAPEGLTEQKAGAMVFGLFDLSELASA